MIKMNKGLLFLTLLICCGISSTYAASDDLPPQLRDAKPKNQPQLRAETQKDIDLRVNKAGHEAYGKACQSGLPAWDVLNAANQAKDAAKNRK